MEDQSYLSDAAGMPDLKGGFVTYKALPCPLPEAWRNEFMAAKGLAEVVAVERRCRGAMGIGVTRKYIPPIQRCIK